MAVKRKSTPVRTFRECLAGEKTQGAGAEYILELKLKRCLGYLVGNSGFARYSGREGMFVPLRAAVFIKTATEVVPR